MIIELLPCGSRVLTSNAMPAKTKPESTVLVGVAVALWGGCLFVPQDWESAKVLLGSAHGTPVRRHCLMAGRSCQHRSLIRIWCHGAGHPEAKRMMVVRRKARGASNTTSACPGSAGGDR